jgi:hypothetical protein
MEEKNIFHENPVEVRRSDLTRKNYRKKNDKGSMIYSNGSKKKKKIKDKSISKLILVYTLPE